MIPSTRTILHAFLKKSPPKERQELLGYLSLEEREAAITSSKTYGDPLKSQEDPGKLLDWIHGSWISPFLRTLSEKDIGLFLGALNPEKAASIGKELLYKGKMSSSNPPESVATSPLGKSFLQTTLVHYLTSEIDDLLPIECLPQSPLNQFLTLSSEAAHEFLDLFGLHDLAAEIKQIIDRQKLSKIHESLSSNQQSYLKVLLQSHEPVVFASMGLTNWSGDQEKLKSFILQRGANRLAKALHGQDRSLFWYILHRLDMDRALLLRKLSTSIDNPRAAQLLANQAVELMNYMNKDTNG